MDNANLMVEVSGAGLKRHKTYFPSGISLRVQIFEKLGQLKVTFEELPVPETYIKVYSRQRGTKEEKFFKDGYTDLRGRFDYGQLSGVDISKVEKFAVFISSEKHGSLVKECNPPSTLAPSG